jgi:hypothetical protein
VSESRQDFERWVLLTDRRACDEQLSEAELEFCRAIEARFAVCAEEVAQYAALADLSPAPDAASRALVDRALAKLEADDAARAVDEVRLLRRSHVPQWLAFAAAVALGLGTVTYAVRDRREPQTQANRSLASASSESHPLANSPLARAELVYSSGDVTVSGGSGHAGRTLLAEGCMIETRNGTACVLIDSDINVCLAANSSARLSAIASPARIIELQRGRLATRLATQPEGMSLSIVANGISSTAVGTAFSVDRRDDHEVVTTVLNGKVRVGRAQEPTLQAIVNAHERAVSHAERPVVTSVNRPEEAPSWELLGPTVLWHDPVAATLEIRGEPAGAEALLDGQPIGISPVSSLIPVGDHRLVVRRDGEELLAKDLHVQAGESREVRYDAAPVAHEVREAHEDRAAKHSGHKPLRLGHAIGAKIIEDAVTPSAPDLLRQARQAMRTGSYDHAATLYQTLIGHYQGSDEAQTALVLLGELRLTQLGDPRGALAPLNAYLQNGGPLEVEARVARIESLRSLQRSDEEAGAIDDFLKHHPRSFEAKGLRARLQELRGAK